MHYDDSTDEYVFASGRRMYCHAQIIGISPSLELSYGYDGDIDWPPQDWWKDYPGEERRPQKTDMLELANEMIDRWSRFKTTLA